jgi:A/G-specific adenine glycosylase
VLVSEVMLQQTSVTRVLPRWERFLRRWPDPAACAAAPLDDVLREWDGLGYPRRARALRDTAAVVAATGWPADEAGLRRLPGIGAYTARALLAFAFDPDSPAPPRDVNLGRVAARAALGAEPVGVPPATLDAAIVAARPPALPMREYAFALFDVGALLCGAHSARCERCPLASCAARGRSIPAGPTRRRPRYEGSMRQLRGEILRALLSGDAPRSADDLERRVAGVAAVRRRPGALAEALAGLADDGLVDARWRPRR